MGTHGAGWNITRRRGKGGHRRGPDFVRPWGWVEKPIVRVEERERFSAPGKATLNVERDSKR